MLCALSQAGASSNSPKLKRLQACTAFCGANSGAPLKTVDAHPHISGYMPYSEDGKSVYYPITEKGVANFVKQSLDGEPATQVTDFQDLVIYGFDWTTRS